MLNLLPPELKQNRRAKTFLFSTTLIYTLIVSAVGLSLLGIATWNFLQQAQISDKTARVDQLTSQKRAKGEIVSQASFIEDRLNSATQYQDSRQWDEVLTEVASATPTNVTLQDVGLTSPKYKPSIELSITGSTNDRRSIVLFRDKLDASSTISGTKLLTISEETTGKDKSFVFSLSATYDQPKAKDADKK